MAKGWVRVLGFAGSLRRGSYNRALVRAAAEVAPEDVRVEVFDLDGIPLYNMDVEQQGLPEAVVAFKRAIREADAVLIATPEHNWSFPGVLKNALDWAARPSGDNPFRGKPVAVVGATTGQWGTLRAQLHLRQVLAYLETHPLSRPEVLVTHAREKFDAEGRLADEGTRTRLRELLVALRDWTYQLARREAP
ncbi:MAG: NAD(P)H-dependent oxidoreductase [Armatimonadota bacterium]|nr:NAD(P)H-dependent oxidoreductase [Armatimonadota bacterium]MDW8156575.1 NAD(P)H-dependent oxidoreductase [Armatimonadota bacterium]